MILSRKEGLKIPSYPNISSLLLTLWSTITASVIKNGLYNIVELFESSQLLEFDLDRDNGPVHVQDNQLLSVLLGLDQGLFI